jgi:excisionase family DNA binding protein
MIANRRKGEKMATSEERRDTSAENATKQRWLSIKEACEYLDVSEQTIYRWMREGVLTFYKIGDSTKFVREDLDLIVQKHVSFKEAMILSDRCPRCGHFELVEGTVQSTGKVYFRPKKTKFLSMLEPLVSVEARVCPRCGHVLLFANTDKLKALQKTQKEESTEGGER